MTMMSKFAHMTLSSFFWHCFVFILKFSYWSRFHVNIMTRNPEIRNTVVRVFYNIFRVGEVRETKVGKNVSNEMLTNTPKFKGYSFYCFWVIKGKPTGGKTTSSPPRLWLKLMNHDISNVGNPAIFDQIKFIEKNIEKR